MGQTEYAKVQKLAQQARQRSATATTKKNHVVRKRLLDATRKKTAYPAWAHLYRFTKRTQFFKEMPPAEVAGIVPRYSENCSFLKKSLESQDVDKDKKLNPVAQVLDRGPDVFDSLNMLNFTMKQTGVSALTGLSISKIENVCGGLKIDSKLVQLFEVTCPKEDIPKSLKLVVPQSILKKPQDCSVSKLKGKKKGKKAVRNVLKKKKKKGIPAPKPIKFTLELGATQSSADFAKNLQLLKGGRRVTFESDNSMVVDVQSNDQKTRKIGFVDEVRDLQTGNAIKYLSGAAVIPPPDLEKKPNAEVCIKRKACEPKVGTVVGDVCNKKQKRNVATPPDSSKKQTVAKPPLKKQVSIKLEIMDDEDVQNIPVIKSVGRERNSIPDGLQVCRLDNIIKEVQLNSKLLESFEMTEHKENQWSVGKIMKQVEAKKPKATKAADKKALKKQQNTAVDVKPDIRKLNKKTNRTTPVDIKPDIKKLNKNTAKNAAVAAQPDAKKSNKAKKPTKPIKKQVKKPKRYTGRIYDLNAAKPIKRLAKNEVLTSGQVPVSMAVHVNKLHTRFPKGIPKKFVTPVDCPIAYPTYEVCTVKGVAGRKRRKRLAKKGYAVDLVNAVVSTFPKTPIFTKEKINYEKVTAEDILYLKTMRKKPETARKFVKEKFSCFTASAWYRAQQCKLIPPSKPVPLPPYDAKKEKFDPFRRKYAARCVYQPIPMPPPIKVDLTPTWPSEFPKGFFVLSKQYREYLTELHDVRIAQEYDFHWEEYGEGRITKFQNTNFRKLLL